MTIRNWVFVWACIRLRPKVMDELNARRLRRTNEFEATHSTQHRQTHYTHILMQLKQPIYESLSIKIHAGIFEPRKLTNQLAMCSENCPSFWIVNNEKFIFIACGFFIFFGYVWCDSYFSTNLKSFGMKWKPEIWKWTLIVNLICRNWGTHNIHILNINLWCAGRHFSTDSSVQCCASAEMPEQWHVKRWWWWRRMWPSEMSHSNNLLGIFVGRRTSHISIACITRISWVITWKRRKNAV